ncbi:MAG: hypothetical protein ACOYK7_06515, partial [Pirellulales bacterium]
MADPLSESRACTLLTRLFANRGYSIERNVPFRELGVAFDCDGWDPKARVGFEFLSSQHDDHDDLSLTEYQILMDEQQRGRLHLLILDEVETLTVAELTAAANEFLDEAAGASATRGKNVAAAKRPVRGVVKSGAAVAAKGKPASAKGKPASAKGSGSTVRAAGAKLAAAKRAKPAVGRAGAGKKATAGKPAAPGVKANKGVKA